MDARTGLHRRHRDRRSAEPASGVLSRTAYPDTSVVLHGATAVASRTLMLAQPSIPKRPALVNGTAGVVVTIGGQLFGVMGFTVSGGKIVEIDVIIDPERLRRLDPAVLGD